MPDCCAEDNSSQDRGAQKPAHAPPRAIEAFYAKLLPALEARSSILALSADSSVGNIIYKLSRLW